MTIAEGTSRRVITSSTLTPPPPAARIPLGVGGLGAALPPTRITNDYLAAQVETSDQWIVERTGIRERRVLGEGLATSDLAIAAARAALDDAGMAVSDIDTLVVTTCTPDQPLPSVASFVARELGLRVAAFDLNAACSGWVYGLINAASVMTATGGRSALLVGAEVLSRWMDPADRSTLPLFGDGGAAAVLVPGSGANGPGLLSWDLGVDGDAADLLRVPAGGSRFPATPENIAAGGHFMKMQGQEVFRRAVRTVERPACTVLEAARVDPSEVALFVPHQANARIVDALLPRIGIPSTRTMMNIERYGNTSAASIPLALCEATAAGRLADGDLVLLAGFGAGMTWATVLLRWGYGGAGPAPATTVAL